VSRIGFFTLPHTGHLYPATALGRKLAERGHEVIFFGFIVTKAIIRKAGLSLHPLPMHEEYISTPRKWIGSNLARSLQGLQFATQTVLMEAPQAVRAAAIDGLVVDQMDFAAGSVADLLNIPFVSLSIVPPIYISSDTPPICFRWRYRDSAAAQLRNLLGNTLFRLFLFPILSMINQQRRTWSMSGLQHINDVFSKRALITQIPKALDFPRNGFPSQLVYTGPFHDGSGRRSINFPWERLNGKPLIYASMGTRRNEDLRIFRIIAEACSGIDVQLVISLGGSLAEVGPLAGDPIVVQYAPQLDILSKTSVTITHAGINTTLESLANGVPLVAIPIGDDQPGVAARVERVGAGKVASYNDLSSHRLRKIIQEVMEDSRYHVAAMNMKRTIEQLNGLERAADIIEEAFKKN
jgi:MGT family glycosyltransferase